jgi:site-specific DNA recombinase
MFALSRARSERLRLGSIVFSTQKRRFAIDGHAQREACEAFIKSQAGEGWRLIRTAYDDGGFSGGNMERPALKQLLADIREQLVDVVVVYKVDRLTRSLADFAKMVEQFDAHGGVAPLGYEVRERKLVINEREAERVKYIYQKYLELKSVRLLKQDLDKRGIHSRVQVWKNGPHGGGSFSRGALYEMLASPIYIGEIRHKQERYPGQRQATSSANCGSGSSDC